MGSALYCGAVYMFTRNIKKIKSANHKNGDIDGTCKRGLTQYNFFKGYVN